MSTLPELSECYISKKNIGEKNTKLIENIVDAIFSKINKCNDNEELKEIDPHDIKKIVGDYVDSYQHQHNFNDVYEIIRSEQLGEKDIAKFMKKITPEQIECMSNIISPTFEFNFAKIKGKNGYYVFYEFVFMYAPLESIKKFMEITKINANYLPNKSWLTPLMLACKVKRDDVIIFLINEKECDISIRSSISHSCYEFYSQKYEINKNIIEINNGIENTNDCHYCRNKCNYFVSLGQLNHCDYIVCKLLSL